MRENILSLVQTNDFDKKLEHANYLASRLSRLTDGRNGTGLFVIIEGKKAETTRIILNRFREDEVVLSKIEEDNFIIELLKEAFSKRSKYYKLAVFEDIISDKSFWRGYAIDKQRTTSEGGELSAYWIKDFLLAETSINPIQGTREFSKVIRKILKSAETLEEKEQLIAGILSLKHKTDQPLSIEKFCNDYLTDDLRIKIKSEIKDDYIFKSYFDIDSDTYQKELGSKVTGLDNDVIVTAPTFAYDKYVEEEALPDGATKLSVTGKIVDKLIKRA